MNILPEFLKIKKVPSVECSSNQPLNFTPRIKTLLFLILGLAFFGFGESLLIHSTIGVSPWTVLAEGISKNLNWSIGFATFVCSVGVNVMATIKTATRSWYYSKSVSYTHLTLPTSDLV